jgi:hypothetical protein
MSYVARLGSDLLQEKDTLRMEQVGGSHLFLIWCLCFEMIYLWWYIIKSLLNNETTMMCLIEFWMIIESNDYEMSIEFLMNVETMTKMLRFWNDLFEVDILSCCDEY